MTPPAARTGAHLVDPTEWSARCASASPRRSGHRPELEGRGRAQHAQSLVRILHAGQLHHDAVHALTSNDRLGDAQFIDAITERGDVLLDRKS
jgi:hypothetical protein